MSSTQGEEGLDIEGLVAWHVEEAAACRRLLAKPPYSDGKSPHGGEHARNLLAFHENAASTIQRLQGERDRAVKIADEAHACFEAAMVEGWIDALENGEVEAIRDFWNRRVSYAYSALSALSDGLSGGGEGGGGTSVITTEAGLRPTETPHSAGLAEAYRRATAGKDDDLDVLGDLPRIISEWVINNLEIDLTLTEARQSARAALQPGEARP